MTEISSSPGFEEAVEPMFTIISTIPQDDTVSFPSDVWVILEGAFMPTDMSDKFASTLGNTRENIGRHPILKLVHPHDFEIVAATLARLSMPPTSSLMGFGNTESPKIEFRLLSNYYRYSCFSISQVFRRVSPAGQVVSLALILKEVFAGSKDKDEPFSKRSKAGFSVLLTSDLYFEHVAPCCLSVIQLQPFELIGEPVTRYIYPHDVMSFKESVFSRSELYLRACFDPSSSYEEYKVVFKNCLNRPGCLMATFTRKSKKNNGLLDIEEYKEEALNEIVAQSFCDGQNGDNFFHIPHRRSYKKPPKNFGSEKRCESCKTNVTPEWRKGPNGPKTLCNACGLHYSKSMSSLRKTRAKKGNKEGSRLSPISPPSPNSNKCSSPSQDQLTQPLSLSFSINPKTSTKNKKREVNTQEVVPSTSSVDESQVNSDETYQEFEGDLETAPLDFYNEYPKKSSYYPIDSNKLDSYSVNQSHLHPIEEPIQITYDEEQSISEDTPIGQSYYLAYPTTQYQVPSTYSYSNSSSTTSSPVVPLVNHTTYPVFYSHANSNVQDEVYEPTQFVTTPILCNTSSHNFGYLRYSAH